MGIPSVQRGQRGPPREQPAGRRHHRLPGHGGVGGNVGRRLDRRQEDPVDMGAFCTQGGQRPGRFRQCVLRVLRRALVRRRQYGRPFPGLLPESRPGLDGLEQPAQHHRFCDDAHGEFDRQEQPGPKRFQRHTRAALSLPRGRTLPRRRCAHSHLDLLHRRRAFQLSRGCGAGDRAHGHHGV